MSKTRNVILFGAGAVLDWKAPSTAEITNIVRKSGFICSDGKTTITEFIYQHLNTNTGYPKEEINFETIINVIEELIVYYSEHGRKKKLPSLIKGFFKPTFEDELLNFAIDGHNNSNRFKLEIPKGVKSEYAATSNGEETPEQFFLQQLIAHLLTEIVASISKYAYHTLGKSEVITDENKELNECFSNWIKHINGENTLRMFTLNYDRNFKVILENATKPYKIFEGFECDHAVDYSAKLIPDVQKIITDTDSNIHYNLHGSAFWSIKSRNGGLSTPQYVLTAAPVLPINFYEHSTFQSEKGKTIMLTNIITGYQKTQKGIFAPFRQMQSTFDKDCCIADNVYIIGYSFGDEHINMSIRVALRYNLNVKFVIVDPGFTKNEFDLDVALKIFSYSDNMNLMQPRTINKNIHSFFNGRVIVHTKTFIDYMKSSLSDPYEFILGQI